MTYAMLKLSHSQQQARLPCGEWVQYWAQLPARLFGEHGSDRPWRCASRGWPSPFFRNPAELLLRPGRHPLRETRIHRFGLACHDTLLMKPLHFTGYRRDRNAHRALREGRGERHRAAPCLQPPRLSGRCFDVHGSANVESNVYGASPVQFSSVYLVHSTFGWYAATGPDAATESRRGCAVAARGT